MKGIKSRLESQPLYKIGQAVKTVIRTEDRVNGFKFDNTVIGYISVIVASRTDKEDTYSYGITTDIPGCYRNGKNPFKFILENDIILDE